MKFYDAGEKPIMWLKCLECRRMIKLSSKTVKVGSRRAEITCPYCLKIESVGVNRLLRDKCYFFVSTFQIDENMKRLGLR